MQIPEWIIGKTRFHKSHQFDQYNNVPMLSDLERPGIGGDKTSALTYKTPSLYPPKQAPLLPPWLNFDKKVLCFDAYFRESLPEIDRIPFQVRKVKILYYLEDGTMQVSEPRILNSGIPQGCLVTRTRIPKPPPNEHEFTTLLDLNINKTITLFNRIYFITGCDCFTRKFLNRLGIALPDSVLSPIDPGTELRKKQDAAKNAKRLCAKIDTLGKFLENDRKVLRFKGFWDDRSSVFGDVHEFEVLYHLGDDTMEIKEKLPANSGRDSNGMLLRRGKLPKNHEGSVKMGQSTPITVLNVLGKGPKGGRFLADCTDLDTRTSAFYTDRDFTIGSYVNVYGRSVLLTDMDPFTKEYYRKKYGVDDFTPILQYSSSLTKPFESHPKIRERLLPPYNGWGSHEDSEGNCITVEPKPPKIDFKKFIIYDRCLLRFGARMISKTKENNERVFVITIYLSDDTISVYEMAVRNSGFIGGEFFKRAKFYLPNENIFGSHRPQIYLAQNFFLGSFVSLRDHKFLITTADIFALNFMENHPEEFALSNLSKIVGKIRDALRPIYKTYVADNMDKIKRVQICGENVSIICYEDLRSILIELLEDRIVEQEIVTLCRKFAAEPDLSNICDKEMVRSSIHAEFNRHLWDDLQRTKEHLYHLEPSTYEYMTQKKLLSAIRACKMPLDYALIEKMFMVLNKNEQGEMEIRDFLNILNPFETPSRSIQPLNIKRDVCLFSPYTITGKMVNWDLFLTAIDLENELSNQT